MTTRSRGTGLGLAIVRKIVEDHFGAIAFRDRPGGGTLVELDFNLETLRGLAGNEDDPEILIEDTRLPALNRSGNG
jgi:two-component system nitrogen regulation sensor histidine kinase NtrY